MSQERIRVGIVGANVHYGWGSRAHIPAFLALPEYELRAICTAHQETAEEAAHQFGAPLAFHDYAEMVQHPDIDLVSVAVRVPSHRSIVTAALKAGKHVFCEWPLGATVAEAEEMASLAQSQGVRHMVGLQGRGSPAILRLRELVQEGFVGDVLACEMTMFQAGITRRAARGAWSADRRSGVHALSVATGHTIDALCFCLGEFSEMSAQVSTQVKELRLSDTQETVQVTAPDNILVSGVLQSGAVTSVHVGSIPWHGSGWRMEVYGTEGTLVADSQQMVQMADIRLRGAKGTSQALEELPVPDRLTWVPEAVPGGAPFNVAQMFRPLANGIREGRDVEPNFTTALHRHRLLDALERASETGQRQQVG